MDLTISIVTYRNNRDMLLKAIDSALNTKLNIRLYISDNSPTDEFRNLSDDPRVEYLFNNANDGFGVGHNIVMRKILDVSKYHLVLNPDVYFEGGVLEELFNYMEQHPDIGIITPRVLYPDGSPQYVSKLLPTPWDFFVRRFLKIPFLLKKVNYRLEMQFSGYNKIMTVPYMQGSFMLIRNKALKEHGLFDERIFMYMEDGDLSRRLLEGGYRNIYYPYVTIYHGYARGAHKNLKLMWYAIHGIIIYFNTWGWFFDKSRKIINDKVIKEIQNDHTSQS